jgi:hypothetical protein
VRTGILARNVPLTDVYGGLRNGFNAFGRAIIFPFFVFGLCEGKAKIIESGSTMLPQAIGHVELATA